MSKTSSPRSKSRGAGSSNAGQSLFDEVDAIDVLSFFGVLRRRKWLIALITIIGTAAAGLYSMSLIPTYTAKSAVLIQPTESRVFDIEAVMNGLTPDQATIATQIRILQSRTYQARVMEDLGLFEDPEFNPVLGNDDAADDTMPLEIIAKPLRFLSSLLPDEWLIATGLAREVTPILESEAPRLGREAAINIFNDNLQVFNDGSSHVIYINYTSHDPAKAAKIANRTAEIYVDDQLKNKLFATDRASLWLQERLAELKEEVRNAEEAVAAFKAGNYISSGDGGGMTLNQQELSDLNKALIVARGELAEKQAKLRLVRDLTAAGKGLDSISEVVNSPLILNLRQQETELSRQEGELATLYGDRHPRMQQLRDEKTQLEAKIEAEIQRIIRTLQNDVSVTSTRIATIESQLGNLKTQSASDRASEVKLAELERQAEASRQLYEAFLQRFKETREQLEIVQPDVRIVAIANPPTSPSSPGPKLFTAAGFTVSFIFGTLLALVMERLDRGIRSSREVERFLDLNTLGLVPRLDRLKKNQKPYQYLMDKPLSAYAEAIRGIYMAVKLSNVDREPKVVLVTSSLPQEGKTTFAVSLAAFAARSHKRVLLIDLDLRHPSVHRELGWQVSGGIVEYMAGERTLDEVIHHDLETGLHFLPIKGQTTNPTDLLDSQKMQLLLEALRENYDYIVLDSAPLASVTDTRIAARLADKVIFVIKWGETVASAAEDSVQSLRDVGVEPGGVVLTQIDMKKHAQYGYGDIGEYYSQSQKYYVN